MKKFRKIMAVLVAAMMIMATMVPAWADNDSGTIATENGSITINNAQDGETYNAYQIFALLSFNDTDNEAGTGHHDTDLYSYGLLSTSKWADFFDVDKKPASDWSEAWGSDYITVDKTLPITITGTGAGLYYPIKAKTSSQNFAGMADETTRADWLDGIASNEVQAFARAAKAYIEKVNNDANDTNNITPTKTINASTGTGTGTTGANGTTNSTNYVKIVFDNLQLGYYLVDSTVGSLCALDTTNKAAVVSEKNLIPTISKKVLKRGETVNRTGDKVYTTEDEAKFVKDTDYEIGKEVTFKTTINLGAYAKDYVLHDVMEKGFSYVANSIKVFYTDSENPTKMKEALATQYTVKTESTVPAVSDGCDFEITFDNKLLLDAITVDNAKIEVEYKARLNQYAEIFGETVTVTAANVTTISPIEGNPAVEQTVAQVNYEYDGDGINDNYAILSYGVGSSTTWDEARVHTYQFDISKITESDNKLLAGAKFKIYTADGADVANHATTGIPQVGSSASPLGFTEVASITDARNGDSKYYARSDTGQTPAYEFTSDNAKKLNFRGLAPGTYYIQESEAPLGYDAIPGLIKVEIIGTEVIGTANAATEGFIKVTKPTNPYSGAVTSDAMTWKGTVDGTTHVWSAGGVDVINKTSKELPSTGGMGTTVLYIVGGMLVILAGAYLFFSRKRTA